MFINVEEDRKEVPIISNFILFYIVNSSKIPEVKPNQFKRVHLVKSSEYIIYLFKTFNLFSVVLSPKTGN